MKTKIKKDWQGRVKSTEELHLDSKLWLSEIDFINFEIRFLERLLSSKYVDYLDAGLYDRIKEFTKEIFNKKADAITLKELVFKHEKILSDLIHQNCVTSNKNYLSTHNNLAIEINTFISKYKYLKMQVFEIVESVMEKQDQKKLN
jgi:hypothetical protein